MNTKDKKFTEVYYEMMNVRNTEAENVKKGDIVENRHGARFVVEAISKNYEEVKSYDKTGECASYMKYSKRINENTYWVGLRDKFNDIYVYPYNDDGVRFVESAVQNDTSKKHNSLLEAYNAVLCPVEEAKKKSIDGIEDKHNILKGDPVEDTPEFKAYYKHFYTKYVPGKENNTDDYNNRNSDMVKKHEELGDKVKDARKRLKDAEKKDDKK